MRIVRLTAVLAGLVAVATVVEAQTKVESAVVAPQGDTITNVSFALVSNPGLHTLCLAPKGSRYVYLYDGVEGPRFDRASDRKVLSADGKRHAYAAVVGTEAILVLDGKEVARAPMDGSLSPFTNFDFSPTGKRFWYVIPENKGASYRLVVDGVPSDPCDGIDSGSFAFSPDESRYAVLMIKNGDQRGMLLMVDGKNVGFQGAKPQFSPDGKNILTIGNMPDTSVLLINGKPASRAPIIHSVHMSTGGLNFLVLSPSRNPSGSQAQFLGAGGKKIEGSECEAIEKVYFSPDGKHYAALCQAGGRKYMFIDGKKGLTYEQIMDFQFTPDSGKALYVAVSGGQQFLVVGEEESDGYQTVQPIVVSTTNRIGYIGRPMGQPTANVVVDGKSIITQVPQFLGFSPDGSHYGFQGGRGMFQSLYLDGTEQAGVGVLDTNFSHGLNHPRFSFSPDGQHVAHFGFVKGDAGKRGLVLDGKLVDPMNGLYCLPFFTPDGNHIVYFRPVYGGGYEVMVDGKAVEKFTGLPVLPPGGKPFEMSEDGTFTFLATSDGKGKRYRVTPGSDTSVATLLASAK